MIRMSMLRNCPVLYQEKQIGLLQNIRLDSAQNVVHSLIVGGGFKGKRIVKKEQILALQRGFILISGSDRYNKAQGQESARFVRDSSGVLSGRITDYMLDEKTLCVKAFEIMRGYIPHTQREKIWAFSWFTRNCCSDEIVVPNVFVCRADEDVEEE